MDRRDFLVGTAFVATALSAPAIMSAQVSSQTPVADGKRVRRKLSSLANDDPFFDAYRRAVELMHEQPESSPISWIAQARKHGDFCAHGTLEFFPWHRPYLVLFERICGALIGDPDFALPYWDWADNKVRLPAPFFGGSLDVASWNDDGRYFGQNWGPINSVPHRYGRADLGAADHPGFAGVFSPSSLQAMEDARDYQLLSDLTENPHGVVHVFTGGDSDFNLGTRRGHFRDGLSPLDPCFWLHHANVDRIWAQSQIPLSDQLATMPDPNKIYEGIFHDENGAPVRPAMADQFDFSKHDYIYDFMLPELLSEEQRAQEEQIAAAQSQILSLAEQRGFDELQLGRSASAFANAPVERTIAAGAILRLNIQSEGVIDVISSQALVPRQLSILDSAFAIGTGRVYARLNNVKPLAASDGNSVKVFVNCPYLSDATPSTDPHFAGMLSFFGCNPEFCGPRSFSVDITEPLNYLATNGSLTPDSLQLQLLSVTGDGRLTGKDVADVGSVELIGA
ncbi:tyrosinase family protein [uncultured Roseobacter sp.]|uniref:tyrosinase family protein n=1 Tax=uncultured Roseobacter sp. TaxID=114847 RepID=UPI002630CE53|nr:tyrosinase family protein [uncultured Roseobacter sp.]